MEENKNKGQQNEPKVEESEIHGRLYNSKNPAFKNKDSVDDISHVDEQEGTMNRGTIGGNKPVDTARNRDSDKGGE